MAKDEVKTPVSSGPLGDNVQDMLNWADTHNLDLAATRHETEAKEASIKTIDALDDPVFRLERQSIDKYNPELPSDKTPVTKYTILQSFPIWGKGDLRLDIAQAEFRLAQAKSAAARAELHAQIKSAFALYFQARRATLETKEIIRLINNLEKVTQGRYINGNAPQSDLIKLQIEQTSLRSELIALQSEEHHARTRLNFALNRPSYAALAEPRELRTLPAVLDAVVLEQRLLANNPQLSAQASQLEIAEKSRLLVEKNNYPDLTLGISPTQRGNNIDSWDAMLEVRIPLHQESRSAKNREALSLLAATRERQQSLTNQITGNFREAFDALGNARTQVSLLKNALLPQTELNSQSALIGYQTGKVDFFTLFETQRQVRKIRLDLLKAEVDQDNRLTEIERLLGEEL